MYSLAMLLVAELHRSPQIAAASMTQGEPTMPSILAARSFVKQTSPS